MAYGYKKSYKGRRKMRNRSPGRTVKNQKKGKGGVNVKKIGRNKTVTRWKSPNGKASGYKVKIKPRGGKNKTIIHSKIKVKRR